VTSRHPDLSKEQAVVDHAHDCHDAAIAKQKAIVDGDANAGGDALAQRKLREQAIERLAALGAIDTTRLVAGRLDFKDERSIYIGPCTVMDGSKVAVVDFTRPIARGFYHATEADPLGLMRRRSFDLYLRELRDISDEVFGTLPPRLRGEADAPAAPERNVLDRVAAELERAREPHMRDIVASIVSDQYRMIEAPLEGAFVVQGGPGTGKTAVALHRAVFLMRNNEDLGKVLVVGPNAAFMAFIAQVLPGLGETRVDQLAVGRLAESGEALPQGDDPAPVAALKGDPRMATVVKRAVDQRVRETDVGHAISYSGTTVRMEAKEANDVLRRSRARKVPYMEGRRRFVESMRAAMEDLVQARLSRGLRRRTVDRPALQRQLSNDNTWGRLLERMWPTASPAQVIHDLLTVEQRLLTATEGLFEKREIEGLLRRGVRTVGVHPWTTADLPLIDEAHAIVQGHRPSYGYVIVDEAQDLTPMELRMVARRSRQGDLTLVGDMAQATGAFRYTSWDEVLEHLPTARGVVKDELKIGYRVPRSIMELANLLLPRIAPELQPTQPVREARVDPTFEPATEVDLPDVVALTVADLADDDRTVGVIAPEGRIVDIRGALAAGGITVGDISTDQLEKRTTLLSAGASKGLEFDRVVLVEPWDIVAGSTAGWSELYVALSRATQQLVVVHAKPLPAPLPGGIEFVEEEPEVEADHEPQVADFDEEEATAVEPEGGDLDLDLDLDLDDEPAVEPDPAVDEAQDAPEPVAEIAPDVEVEAPEEIADPVEAVEETVEPEPEVSEPPKVEATAEAEPEPVAVEVELETKTAVEPGKPDPTKRQLPVTRSPMAKQRSRSAPMRLSGDFSEALVFAKLAHQGHTRRGTAVPYLGHLLGTVALVLEDGGTEPEAIAALLHDAVEDGTPDMAATIRDRFGDTVAAIVEGCTDPAIEGSFREVKEEHIRRLEAGSSSVRRVALAEKLDNARALVRDLDRFGDDTWKRMDVDREEMLWYFTGLVALFRRSFPSVLVNEFARAVERIEQLSGQDENP